MVRKTKEQAMATRELLLDAAEEVFFAKGYSLSTLMDIANQAQLTRGAIYWHFKNKESLFEAMLERVHLPIELLAEASTDVNEPDPLGKFRQFSIDFLKKVAIDVHWQRVFSIMFHKFEYNGEVTQIEQRQQTGIIECTDRVERSLHNAISKGQLPKDLDTHQAALAKHAYFSGIISNWLFHPQQYDLFDNADSLVDNFFFMLEHSPHLRLKK